MRLPMVTVLMCLLLLGVADAAAAELPALLPESGSFPVAFEGFGRSKVVFEYEGSLILECTKLKMSGEATSLHAGTYKFDIEGCEAPAGIECHTTGDAKGVLLWSGEFHLVRVSLLPLTVALLLTLPTLSSNCLFGEFRTHENKGYLIPISPINSEFKTIFELSALQSKAVQQFTAYYNDEAALVSGAYLELVSGKRFAMQASPIELVMSKKVKIQA